MTRILASLDEQLRSAREASGESFMWAHIDTCLSSYLQDHHNRDGELLLGVHVDGTTTIGDLLDNLDGEFRALAWDMGEFRKGYDHDKAKTALDKLAADNADRLDRLFDPALEVPAEDEDMYGEETCQAWFLLTWDVPEDGE